MTGFVRWVADIFGYVPREEMESNMTSIEQDMRERLRVASDKAASKLREVEGRLQRSEAENAELRGAAATDSESDAEALRPIVEFLEGLGADPADPVPAVDPVPSDPEPVPGVPGTSPGDGGPVAETPSDPGTEQPGGGTVEQPGATTDAPLDPGTGEVQGGPAV